MASLDPRFVIAPSLEEYFVDKDTGLPLAAGIVSFFSNTNPSTPKPVYSFDSINGYVALPNPCILSAVGTFQDGGGNNIIPFYFPFNAGGQSELYYITVQSSGGVLQFTREDWPPNAQGGNTVTDTTVNFIPNGQFLAHTDVPNGGAIVNSSTPIAQGGWSFETNNPVTDTYSVTFRRITGAISGVTDFPRYTVKVNATAHVSDNIRDLRIKWLDVNKFASPNLSAPQTYTLFFNAQSQDSNTYVVDVYEVKNYGTGGSPTSESSTLLGTLNIAPNFNPYSLTFNFGNNTGTTLGTNNDDFVALDFRPRNSTFAIEYTDFVLAQGSLTITQFPTQTDASMLSEGVAGWMPIPNPDGSDLYLPLRLTRTGLEFDHSVVGELAMKFSNTAGIGELLCDGSGYIGGNYSTDGIPFSRLRDYLILNSPVANVPLFGTGSKFVNAYIFNGDATNIRIVTNEAGIVTHAADSIPKPTNFTFNSINNGNATTRNYFLAYNITTANTILAVANFGVPKTVASAQTSGFTISNSTAASSLVPDTYFFNLLAVAAAGRAGTYFFFSSETGTGTDFYMWFKVNGAGADPLIGGRIGIEVDLLSTWTAQDVANVVRETINGNTSTSIICKAASTLAGGEYFTFSTNLASPNFLVYYTVDGVGAAPVVANTTNILVALASTDTATQVALKTQQAINKYQFAVPDLRGMFARGLDAAATYDIDVATRWSTVASLSGANVGTFEFEQFLTHNHLFTSGAINITAPGTVDNTIGAGDNLNPHGSFTAGGTTNSTGGNEVRPVNFAINWFIKY